MVPRYTPTFPPPWASAWGDDTCGLWADLDVHGVVQRLRWIEPGEFLMGRPDDEEGEDDQVPQHRVRLTHGFWLADTACTQALWQAVMGDNPSYYTGDSQCPVEQVSHVDIDQFLSRLQPLCEGMEPALPTEAEWEYACRAGTTTAFSFGSVVTPMQVNYNGRSSDRSSAGLDRGRTVPVKALPANAWGLYQMHGNVWEWCSDGRRTYLRPADNAVQLDPLGSQEQKHGYDRALRGGSWLREAQAARSAHRFHMQRRTHIENIGFRLALRP